MEKIIVLSHLSFDWFVIQQQTTGKNYFKNKHAIFDI